MDHAKPSPIQQATVPENSLGGWFSEAQTTSASAPLARTLAHTPEPPLTVVVVSYRRENWPSEWSTRRVMFDHIEDAVGLRARLEQPERTHGEGPAVSVRLDVAGAWAEARA